MLKLKNLAPREGNEHYKPEVKYQAVTTYLATGNLKMVANAMEIPYYTLREWFRSDWWKEYEFEIANAKKTETSTKLGKIVDKSLELLEDRLVNGDIIMNQKTGELVRRDVQLRDITQVLNTVLQRQADLERQKKEQSVIQQQESVQDVLKQLASEFAKFNGRKAPQVIDVEDAEVKEDALH